MTTEEMNELVVMEDEWQKSIQEELEILRADAALARERAGEVPAWLPQWYLGQLAQLEAAEKAVKDNSDRLLRQIAGRRRALQYQWFQPFREVVERDLKNQKGRKKSVTYATGVAGFRSVGGRQTILIDDEQAAIAAAETACPAAVKRSLLKTLLMELAKATGEVLPGTRLETTPVEQRFYPWGNETPEIEGE